MKIDQQPHLPSTQSHIGKQLGFVDRIDCFDALNLNDDAAGDKEINAISKVDLFALLNDWQPDLTGDNDSSFSKLVDETCPVGALEQTRPQGSVNSHCRADDLAGDFVDWRSDLLRHCSHASAYITARQDFSVMSARFVVNLAFAVPNWAKSKA
jgi:hypothetical protein